MWPPGCRLGLVGAPHEGTAGLLHPWPLPQRPLQGEGPGRVLTVWKDEGLPETVENKAQLPPGLLPGWRGARAGGRGPGPTLPAVS